MYYKWSTADDIPLFLQLISPTTGLGASGLAPEVAIRRHRASQGGAALDDFYWNGTIFTSTPTFLTMTELDPTNSAGLYTYLFDQTIVGNNHIYLVYFRHTASAPIGVTTEEHMVTDEISIPISSPAVPVLPGDTVMGRLADMEDPLGPVNQATADAVWDEPINQHCDPGSTGEALKAAGAATLGLRQIDILVEDTGSIPIQGAIVDVYDNTNTIFLFRVFTDSNGMVSVGLDDGSYNVRLFASGYGFTVPEVLVVSADASVTYQGGPQVSITPPSAPDLCVIFGTIRDAGGKPLIGACVEAFAVVPQVVSGVQKAEALAKTVTDTNGFFQIELVRNTSVNFRIEDTDIDFVKTVPDAPAQDVTTWP